MQESRNASPPSILLVTTTAVLPDRTSCSVRKMHPTTLLTGDTIQMILNDENGTTNGLVGSLPESSMPRVKRYVNSRCSISPTAVMHQCSQFIAKSIDFMACLACSNTACMLPAGNMRGVCAARV